MAMAPKDFDVNSYLNAKPAFDVKKYLGSTEAVDEGVVPDEVEAFGVGVANQIPIAGSYLPQISAGAKKAASYLTGDDVDYSKERDETSAYFNKLKEENPGAYGTGNVVGFGGSLLAGGAIAKAIGGAGKLANAGLKARAMASAGSGAATGFLENPGDTEGEVDALQIADRLKNAGVGAVFGGAGEFAGRGLSKALSKGSTKAADTAEDFAEYALRGKKRFQGDIKGSGRILLDEGVIGNRPVDPETLLARVEPVKSKYGSNIRNVAKKLDDEGSGANVSVDDFKKSIKDLLEDNVDITDSDKAFQKMEKFIDRRRQGKQNLSTEDLQDFKQFFGKQGWPSGKQSGIIISDGRQAARDVNRYLGSYIEDTAEQAAEQSGDEAILKLLRESKKKYGPLKGVTNALRDRVEQDRANLAFGLIEGGIGTAGTVGSLMQGDSAPESIAKGIATGMAVKGVRKYGSQVAAKQLDNIAKLMAKGAKKTGEVNNPFTAAILSQLVTGQAAASMPKRSPKVVALEQMLAEQERGR